LGNPGINFGTASTGEAAQTKCISEFETIIGDCAGRNGRPAFWDSVAALLLRGVIYANDL
jgi:hypothetical protein